MSERRITARRDGGWPDDNLELGHGRSFGPELKFEHGFTVQELLRIFRRRKRLIAPGPARPAGTWPFRFETDTRLVLSPATPRPWAHVLANPTGFGG